MTKCFLYERSNILRTTSLANLFIAHAKTQKRRSAALPHRLINALSLAVKIYTDPKFQDSILSLGLSVLVCVAWSETPKIEILTTYITTGNGEITSFIAVIHVQETSEKLSLRQSIDVYC